MLGPDQTPLHPADRDLELHHQGSFLFSPTKKTSRACLGAWLLGRKSEQSVSAQGSGPRIDGVNRMGVRGQMTLTPWSLLSTTTPSCKSSFVPSVLLPLHRHTQYIEDTLYTPQGPLFNQAALANATTSAYLSRTATPGLLPLTRLQAPLG